MKEEIRLTLKSTWYRLVGSGMKLEEYRDIKPYYCSRLCENYDPKKYDCQHCAKSYCQPVPSSKMAHFTLGYPANTETYRHLFVKIKGMRKGYGKWIWGAPGSRKVFIIELESPTPPIYEKSILYSMQHEND